MFWALQLYEAILLRHAKHGLERNPIHSTGTLYRGTPKSRVIGSDKGLSLSLVLARGTLLGFFCCARYDERHFCSLSSHHGGLNGS